MKKRGVKKEKKMATPTSTATGKPPATWTDTKYTTPVKTSQGGKMMAKVPDSKPFNNPIVSDQRLTQGEDGKWLLTGKDKAGKSVSIPWDLQKQKPLETKPEEKSGVMAKAKSGLQLIEGGGQSKSTGPKKNLWNPKQYKPGTTVVIRSEGQPPTVTAGSSKVKAKPVLHTPSGAVTKVTLKDELSTPYQKLKETV
jgi:hypothetical protein